MRIRHDDGGENAGKTGRTPPWGIKVTLSGFELCAVRKGPVLET